MTLQVLLMVVPLLLLPTSALEAELRGSRRRLSTGSITGLPVDRR